MHGLIFKTSIYYRQDQPGSYHLSRTSRRKLTPSYAHTTTCMHRQSRPRLSAHLECCCSKALKLPRRLAEKWLSHLHTHRNAWSVRTCHPSRLSNLRLQYGLAGNPQSAELPSSVRPQAYFLLTQSALFHTIVAIKEKRLVPHEPCALGLSPRNALSTLFHFS